jgi:hypothetical protein
VKRRLVVICLAATSLTAACSIGGGDQVEEVDADLLGGLNEPTAETSTPDGTDPTTSTTPGSTTSVATELVRVYFIEGSQLVSVDIEVPQSTSLRGKLRLLEEGPPDEYSEDGVRTALAPNLISGVALGGTDGARVTFDSELFAGVDDADQRLMVGQIVLTLTDQPGIDQVDFSLDGEPLAVFDRNNTLSEPGEAVGRDDYEVLLAGAEPRTVDSSSATTDASRSSVSLTSGP